MKCEKRVAWLKMAGPRGADRQQLSVDDRAGHALVTYQDGLRSWPRS